MKTTINTALAVAALLALGVATANAEEAKVLYEKNCASCHGKDGVGKTTMGRKEGVKDYTDPKSWEGLTDEKAFESVKEGMTENGKVKMKPFAEKLKDDEIKAVIAYLKTFKKA
jgi:mono/diheme cytochrome c family protein